MVHKNISKKDDPFYIEQDEESGQLFSRETLANLLDTETEEPYQDKILVTDKYGELKVMLLPVPLESAQARPVQLNLESGRPEEADLGPGRPEPYQTQNSKLPKFKGKKFDPKLMETYGGTLKKLGQYAQK